MESLSHSQRCRNPIDESNFISRLLFWWTYNVIKKGRQKAYEIDDLPSPAQDDYAHMLGNKLEESWSTEVRASKEGKKPSLLKALIRIFWRELMCIFALNAFNDFILGIMKQILLGYFLLYLKRSKKDPTALTMLKYLGVSLVFSHALHSLLQNHFLCKAMHLGGRIKIALSSVIYRKCLHLGSYSSINASAGHVVNLLSNDLRQFDFIIMYCTFMWSGLITSTIILVIIAQFMGLYPVLGCLLSIVAAMPLQIMVSKLFAKNRIQTAYASDKRIQIMDEIVNGIQIIKMYAWEIPYEKLITVLRGAELKLLRKNVNLRGLQVTINLFTSKFSQYVLVVLFALLGGDVLPEKVFLIMGYTSTFARILCAMTFRSFGECLQCRISIKRLQAFLEMKEFEKPAIKHISTLDNAIILSDVTASWSLDSSRDTLKNISLSVKAGHLTTVIGEVASGKSSLLNVILGELPIQEGKFMVNGLVSYYCQSPWIFPGTIKQNILFSENFEKSRYDRVVEVCELKRDFEILPNGDQTLIGDRGTTLSGGQKARIALARTIYKRADIYLLDDPLSAVDASVGKHIFDECIIGFLKEKTRIMVSHQLQFLMASNSIVLLEEGKIVGKGNFQDIMNSDSKYIDTLKAMNLDSGDEKVEADTSENIKEIKKEMNVENIDDDSAEKELEKEDIAKVKRNAFLRFVLQGVGVSGMCFLFCVCILTQLTCVYFDVWFSFWTSHTENSMRYHNVTVEEKWTVFSISLTPTEYYIIGLTVIGISMFPFALMRNTYFAYCGQKCAKTIHEKAFRGVVYTNMEFFNNNPPGRILNRFSKDMGAIDDPLVMCLLEAITSMLQVISSFIVSASINITFIPPAVIAFISLFSVKQFYMKTSRNLKRLESVAKSPVFVHLHSTLEGLSTIHTSSTASSKLVEEFDQYQDIHTSAWFLYNFANFGYVYALEVIGVAYMAVLVIGTFFIDLTGSQVGLSLAQMVVLLNFIQWAMKQTAEVSNQITSIDRMLKYSSLPSEALLQGKVDDNLGDDWPFEGSVLFENVSLRYSLSSTPSINNVSFTVQPQEKIGIVGRTGAGKTSLLAGLFRLGYVEGSIKIDGVDTKTVRLSKLRSSISIIPQDPVLFSGSIRKNLDPFGEYDDTALWSALEEAELKNVLSEVGGMGLNTEVTQGGKNFSVGQRQLICLARAIIRKNKILVLDEATASVDQKTDNIIQKTIREKFKSCTVLTIAHRLNTVIDSDKILVMDSGTSVEFDHPYALLKWEGSNFYKLVSEAGESVVAALRETAKKNYTSQ